MENKAIYYVYVYLDPNKPGNYVYDSGNIILDHEPFYIGKGHGNRLYDHLKLPSYDTNKLKKNKIKKILSESKSPPIIKIIKQNLHEQAAFDYEKRLITMIGRRDLSVGPLCNLTDGGEGRSGSVVSDETKEKLRQINLGKPSPNKGKKLSKKVIEKLKRTLAKKYSDPNYKRPPMSKKTREKIRIANLNKKLTNQQRENIRKNSYIIITPENKEIEITNMSYFCEQHNLTSANMFKVLHGERYSHKGYRCYIKGHKYKLISKNPNPSASKKWLIIYPNKTEKIITNLAKFCREHGLCKVSMTKVSKNQYKQHKQYRCIKLN